MLSKKLSGLRKSQGKSKEEEGREGRKAVDKIETFLRWKEENKVCLSWASLFKMT